MEPVAVLGVAQTEHRARWGELRLEELAFRAAGDALKDAGLERDDVDCVVIAGSDQLDGRAISSMVMSCAAGAYLKDELKVSDGGAFAVLPAAMRILAGLANVALVVSWTKASESPVQRVMHLTNDPVFHRDVGLNDVVAAGAMAQAYQARAPGAAEAAARVVVRSLAAGRTNPMVQAPSLDPDEVAASPFASWPIRAAEWAPPRDGACAVVLGGGGHAGRAKALLAGMGWATDVASLGERAPARLDSLSIAAAAAYERAGVRSPATEIACAEVHDQSAWHVLLAMEALGFCAELEAPRAVDEGTLPSVNPSGGALCGNPPFAASLVRVVEAVLQVSGRAGAHQVPDAGTVVAHGSTGFAAQGNTVFVLRAP